MSDDFNKMMIQILKVIIIMNDYITLLFNQNDDNVLQHKMFKKLYVNG